MLSYRVLWFERDGRGLPAAGALSGAAAACVVDARPADDRAAGGSGADIAERERLGADRRRPQRSQHGIERAAERRHSPPRSPTKADAALPTDAGRDGRRRARVIAAAHRYVAATPSALVLVQADDFAGEIDAINLPGTDRERPNWRRKVGVPAAGLWESPVGRAAQTDFAASGRTEPRRR